MTSFSQQREGWRRFDSVATPVMAIVLALTAIVVWEVGSSARTAAASYAAAPTCVAGPPVNSCREISSGPVLSESVAANGDVNVTVGPAPFYMAVLEPGSAAAAGAPTVGSEVRLTIWRNQVMELDTSTASFETVAAPGLASQINTFVILLLMLATLVCAAVTLEPHARRLLVRRQGDDEDVDDERASTSATIAARSRAIAPLPEVHSDVDEEPEPVRAPAGSVALMPPPAPTPPVPPTPVAQLAPAALPPQPPQPPVDIQLPPQVPVDIELPAAPTAAITAEPAPAVVPTSALFAAAPPPAVAASSPVAPPSAAAPAGAPALPEPVSLGDLSREDTLRFVPPASPQTETPPLTAAAAVPPPPSAPAPEAVGAAPPPPATPAGISFETIPTEPHSMSASGSAADGFEFETVPHSQGPPPRE